MRRRLRRGAVSSVPLWIVLALVSFGLWLLLVGSVDAGEIVVGAFAAAAAATAASVVIGASGLRFAPRLADLAEARRIPLRVVTETWDVFVVLARHLFTRRKAGSIVYEEPFDARDDSRAAARRALAAAYASATPGCVVLGFDLDRGVVRYHLLDPAPMPRVLERLRGGS